MIYEEEISRSNKELERFAYIVSHDLQEPLRTIKSYLQLFEKKYSSVVDEMGKKFIEVLAKSTDRANAMINDLLNYSRIGRNRTLSEVNTLEIIKSIIEDLEKLIVEKNAEIIFQNEISIRAYESEMHSLIMNLLTNSIKYSKEGIDPKIEITIEENESEYLFVVSDNGVGIEEKDQEDVFKIFNRGSRQGKNEGSGIGLTNSKKIVELHRGKIWIESKVNLGTKVFFTISKNLG